MEPVVFEHSDKNIPVHDDTIVRKFFLHAVTTFDRTLRYFFLHPEKVPEYKNWFGFKSNKAAPQVEELKEFRADLLQLAENLEFRNTSNDFMKKLDKDITKINESDKVIVKADKTSNKYFMSKEVYHRFTQN